MCAVEVKLLLVAKRRKKRRKQASKKGDDVEKQRENNIKIIRVCVFHLDYGMLLKLFLQPLAGD